MTVETPSLLRRFFLPKVEGSTRAREMVERQCDACGRVYQLRVKAFNRRHNLTCSPECRKTKLSKPGAENGSWKGGISKFPYRYKLRQIEKFPKKHAARLAVRRALRSGEMVRQPCEICGSTEKIHGHHTDYSKPLKVVWLCAKHHRIAHGATR